MVNSKSSRLKKLSKAKQDLRIELNEESPILAIISSLTLHFDKEYSFEEIGVRKFDLTFWCYKQS
jgi:hypothetical protein